MKQTTETETHGAEGVCLSCSDPISTHVDKRGQWVGCKNCKDDDMKFILVPVPPDDNSPATRVVESKQESGDRAKFTYVAVDARKKPALSATRAAVYEAIRTAKSPLMARDIMRETKLPHGSIQQTLNWLRYHKLVKAKPITH